MKDIPGNISDDINPTDSRSNSLIPNVDPDPVPDPSWHGTSLTPLHAHFLQITEEQHGVSSIGGFSGTSGLIHPDNRGKLLNPTFSENSRTFPTQQNDYSASYCNYQRQEQMIINQLALCKKIHPSDGLIETSQPTEPSEGDGDLTYEILRFLHGDQIPVAIMKRYGIVSSDYSNRVPDLEQQVGSIRFQQVCQSSGIPPRNNSNMWISPPEHRDYQDVLIVYMYCSSCGKEFSEMDFYNLHRNHEQ